MNGPSLAPILIPIAGTLLLIAWLILGFAAGRPAGRPGSSRVLRPADRLAHDALWLFALPGIPVAGHGPAPR